MVHFEPNDHESAPGERIAPVAYLPGAFGAAQVNHNSPAPVDPATGWSVGARADAKANGNANANANWAAPSAAALDAGTDSALGDDDTDDDSVFDDDDTDDEAAFVDDAEVEFDPVAEREHAESLLLSRLRSRSLSVVEATMVLAGTDATQEDIDDILTRFAELNYLDDNKLADQIIHTHHARKGLGRSGVEAEMRRRKIDQFVILEKLDELPDEEIERATELALTRVRQLSRVDDQTADRRLTGFLLRKGYSSAAVRAAVKAALATRLGSGRTSTVRFQ